jgi:hypothetical protein
MDLRGLFWTVVSWAIILWILVFAYYHRDQVGHVLSTFFGSAKNAH